VREVSIFNSNIFRTTLLASTPITFQKHAFSPVFNHFPGFCLQSEKFVKMASVVLEKCESERVMEVGGCAPPTLYNSAGGLDRITPKNKQEASLLVSA
jgi:hypothetical protein